MDASMHVRHATVADIPALARLVDAAVRELGGRDYEPEQIEGALRHLFRIDTRLIADGTYYVAEVAGQIVGAGGWSRRASLHHGDVAGGGGDRMLDPAREPARIRAFYVHPRWARRGIGRLLLQRCESAAAQAGFAALELIATRTGAPLYAAGGFVVEGPVELPMPGGLTMPCLRMAKSLRARSLAA